MSKVTRMLIRSLAESRSTWSLYKGKPLLERLSMVIYTMPLLDKPFDVYYSIRGFFQNVARVIDYLPVVWRHRNWDYNRIYTFQKKLYQDLYKGCYEQGSHVFRKSEAKKLKTVIGLLGRLEADEYCEWQYDYFNKKYGDNEFIFTPIEGSTSSQLSFSRDERMTKAQKALYLKERKAVWALEELQRKQDMALLHKLVEKNHRKWWD